MALYCYQNKKRPFKNDNKNLETVKVSFADSVHLFTVNII